MKLHDAGDIQRALADYESAVATTQRLLRDITDELRRLTIAIARREDARAALERLQREP